MSDLFDPTASDRGDAVVTPDGRLGYDELSALPPDGPLLLRATPTLSTVIAIHAAVRARRPVVPCAPSITDEQMHLLAARLATLPAEPPPLCTLATSGSTGVPKLVELSRAAWLAHAVAANRRLELRSDDRWLAALPLHHTGGLSILLRCLAARATVVLAEPPPLGPAWSAWMSKVIAEQRVTRLSLVPAQLERLLRDEVAPPPSLRSMLLGGQTTSPSLAVSTVARGWPLLLSYGLTETCGMCVSTGLGDDLSAGVAGRPLDGVQLRLVDVDVDDGVGLLEIDTPARASRVHGAAQPLTTDGWLRTADRARLDGEGLRLLGRADDVIVSAGHKIDPIEIEAVLATIPWVRTSVVLGLPDAIYGTRLGALVVTEDRTDLVAALHAALPSLPRHQRLRWARTVASLPLLASGKVDRRAALASALD